MKNINIPLDLANDAIAALKHYPKDWFALQTSESLARLTAEKPVLRPFQDLKEDEYREVAKILYPDGYNEKEFQRALAIIQESGAACLDFSEMDLQTVAKLISFYNLKGFDLGLLEPGTFILKEK
jgi:hypothetical protein